MGLEINRRLGLARADFSALTRVWRHSSLPVGPKIRIFNACVASQLMYGLHTAKLKKAELGKLDAFQAMRMILGIPHSFYSRVPNTDVLSLAKTQKFSAVILYRQLTLLHRIANLPSDDVMRTCVFDGQAMHIKIPRGKRRRGRPKPTWSVLVANVAIAMLDGFYELSDAFALPQKRWKKRAAQFCFAVP